jgi:dihydroorotate dehydrogenase
VLVKVAPDLSFAALDEILELVEPRRIAGLVATNTTLSRPVSADPIVRRVYAETGGLSGRPLRARSTELIRHLYRQSGGRVPLVGVGGIFSVADAWEKVLAGACLLQVYTGLVYEGPFLARRIVSGLQARMAAEGVRGWDELVGKEA